MPLFAGIAPADRAAAMAAIASDPGKLHPGLPTVAYDHPEYRSGESWPHGAFWRGPTWLNTSYFALKGLKDYGFDELADPDRELVLHWCHRETRSLFEYYNAKTGRGRGYREYGWTGAMVIELILDW